MNKKKQKVEEISDKIRTLMYIKTELEIEIEEEMYDKLRRELEEIEERNPELRSESSPSMQIGFNFKRNRVEEKIKREYAMLSLKNTYELIDVEKWLKGKKDVYFEPKYDGVAVSVEYEGGLFLRGSTRGDGKEGENISEYMRRQVKMEIYDKRKIDIRCEIYGSGGRNEISGEIRKKEVSGVKRQISAYMLIIDGKKQSQEEMYRWIKEQWEKESIYEKYEEGEKIDEKRERIMRQEKMNDGVVIKENDSELKEDGRYMVGAIAYKVSPEGVLTEVEGIEWEMSREGRIIPVIRIREIEILGSKIRRVAGHNIRKIREMREGSEVQVKRIGGVIPEIVGVIRSAGRVEILRCPFCEGEIEGEERCKNDRCWRKKREQVKYYWSKMKIRGIGEKNIDGMEEIIESIKEVKKKKEIKGKGEDDIMRGLGIEGIGEEYYKEKGVVERVIRKGEIRNRKDRELKRYYEANKEKIEEIMKEMEVEGY